MEIVGLHNIMKLQRLKILALYMPHVTNTILEQQDSIAQSQNRTILAIHWCFGVTNHLNTFLNKKNHNLTFPNF